MSVKTTGPVIASILIAGACTVAGATRSTPAPSAIPLCPGLTIVTAVKQQNGDYESIKTIESVSARDVRIKYSAEKVSGDWLDSGPPTTKQVNLFRTVLAQDIRAATQYQQVYLEKSAETIPGTTAIGVSAATLTALKTKGEADLSISTAYGGLELTADADKRPNYYDYLSAGKIARVGKATVPVSVLVNDTAVSLPAIHAQGEIAGEKSEFHILDDESNPLVLAFRIGIGAIAPLDPAMTEICDSLRKGGVSFSQVLGGERCQNPNGGDRDTLRVVKISYRCAAPPSSQLQKPGRDVPLPPGGPAPARSAEGLERALAERGRADIYSIHFSFNSDRIRDESEPTLKEIAGLLAMHPEWKLSIEGHTDDIGGDGSNLDLSRRRSAAVKAALVAKYKIDGNRLSTGGFGKSRPKDTNETLEGRARNRRVELVRQ
jgi:outer membrane protein OmpA-like peptidoglycan-associated protein